MRFKSGILFYLFILIFVLNGMTLAQQWRVIRQPGGQSFRAVHFFNKTNGVAAGNYRLWRSEDGGASWQEQTLPLSGNLKEFYDLYFANANIGWACGRNDENVLLYTTDGGHVWNKTVLPNDGNGTPYWHGIEFADSLHGWAAGFSISTGMQTGLLAATTDGGKSWQLKSQNQFPYLFDVSFADTLRGWACGFGGTIIHTEDGGNTWLRQNTTTLADLYRLQFTDSLRGYAVGCSGTVLKTIDGGKNWQNTLADSNEYFHDLYFVNPETGWVVGSTGTILATIDGGITWEAQQGASYHFLKDVYFMSDSVGWVAGKDGAMFHTEDGGRTWRSIGPGNSWAIKKIQMFDANSGICSGDGEMIMTTSDGGWEWQINYSKHRYPRGFMWMEDGVLEAFDKLQMVSPLIGWAGASYEELYKTSDGGASWDNLNFNTSGFFFTGADSGWAIGPAAQAHLMYKTVNGGVAWEPVMDLGDENIHTLYFFNKLNGWCVTGNQKMLRTTDGGASWDTLSLVTDLTRLFFISPTSGWAIAGTKIYKTGDGGQSWQIQLEGGNAKIRDLLFTDSQLGYALAGNTILVSTDGGNSWRPDYTGEAQDVFYSITSAGDGVLLVGGSGGKIVQRTEANQISQRWVQSKSTEKRLICYPNPFNPSVKIKYVLAHSGEVKINIVDVLGRVVWKNILREQNNGSHEFIWNGRSNTGLPVTSGVYFVQLSADGQWFSEKIVSVK